jgi:hypothetical protein
MLSLGIPVTFSAEKKPLLFPCVTISMHEVRKKFKVINKMKGGIFLFIFLSHFMHILVVFLMMEYLLSGF